jgi:hypothetical protein
MQYGHFVPDPLKQVPDALDVYIEEKGTSVLAPHGRERIAKAFERLEHKADIARAHHGPDEGTLPGFGDGHQDLEAKPLIEIEGGVHVTDKQVGGKGFHGVLFL